MLLTHSKKSLTLQDIVVSIADKLSGIVPIDDYTRRKMSATLLAADIHQTPEAYIIERFIKAAGFALLAIPAFFIMPIIGMAVLAMAALRFVKWIGEAEDIVTLKRSALEAELPRFVSTLAKELTFNTDLLRIFRSYQKYAAPALKKELELTIADMVSSNDEKAFARLEMRVNSTMVSKIVQGLQSVKTGNSGIFHFETLEREFREMELQGLKKEAAERPGKMRKYSALIIVVFIITYLVVLGLGVVESMRMFS